MEIDNQIHTIKEIVDNSMHVMIDEDNLFNFSKKNKKKIDETLIDLKKENQINKIVKSLLKLEILKTDNILAKEELEASCKLIIYLINQETNSDLDKISSYLENI